MSPFLTAEWRWLVMLNYRVPADLLTPLVPAGTELDLWQGDAYASVVGFRFLRTRVRGIGVPWHRNFEEINLRFYVRRVVDGVARRAVVFVREFVPRRAIAWAARARYNEPYRAMPMRHEIRDDGAGPPARIEYHCRPMRRWMWLAGQPDGAGEIPADGTMPAFIAEHYWGYTRQRDGGTVEYEVRHPRWTVWPARAATLDGDVEGAYGPAWAAALRGPPNSAMIADGSGVEVYAPRRLQGVTANP